MARRSAIVVCLLCLGLCLGVTCVAEEPARVAVGKPAPDITLTGIDGKTFKLSDKTSAGRNVALMFSRAHW